MITRTVRIKIPSKHANDPEMHKKLQQGGYERDVEVSVGSKVELHEKLKAEILPYNEDIKLKKSRENDFPFKMEINDALSIDNQFLNLQFDEQGLSRIFF